MVKSAAVLVYLHHNLSKTIYCLWSLFWTKKATEMFVSHTNTQFLQSQFNHIDSVIYIHEKASGLVMRQGTLGHV